MLCTVQWAAQRSAVTCLAEHAWRARLGIGGDQDQSWEGQGRHCLGWKEGGQHSYHSPTCVLHCGGRHTPYCSFPLGQCCKAVVITPALCITWICYNSNLLAEPALLFQPLIAIQISEGKPRNICLIYQYVWQILVSQMEWLSDGRLIWTGWPIHMDKKWDVGPIWEWSEDVWQLSSWTGSGLWDLYGVMTTNEWQENRM